LPEEEKLQHEKFIGFSLFFKKILIPVLLLLHQHAIGTTCIFAVSEAFYVKVDVYDGRAYFCFGEFKGLLIA
jgi:hypothetical protein